MTAKRFPGLGRVTANTDPAAVVTDRVTTRTSSDLIPFGPRRLRFTGNVMSEDVERPAPSRSCSVSPTPSCDRPTWRQRSQRSAPPDWSVGYRAPMTPPTTPTRWFLTALLMVTAAANVYTFRNLRQSVDRYDASHEPATAD